MSIGYLQLYHFGQLCTTLYNRRMSNWIGSPLSPAAPALWLGLSLLSGLVALGMTRLLPEQLGAGGRRWLWLSRWLLIAYLALISGGVSPRLMGLADLNWVRSLTLGAGLVAGLAGLLLLVRLTVVAALPPPTHGNARPTLLSELLWLGAEQFHWSFLRAAIWELLLRLPTPPDLPAYQSLWIATLLALPEALLLSQRPLDRLARGVALLATAIIFFYTRNFWLCWVMHTVVWGLLQKPSTGVRQRPALSHEID